MTLDKDGTVTAVAWDGPAWRAGVVAGAKVQSVNGTAYSAEALKTAIVAARDGGKIDLQVARGATTQAVSVAWIGGPRYPQLERMPGSAALLDDILAPRQ
jgi:S1-C subfamily serine protease